MTRTRHQHAFWSVPAALGWVALTAALMVSGCAPGVETSYGRSRTRSVNGTGLVAGMFRQRGHEVRTAVRLTDELHNWADVIVRFATRPGPPDLDEAGWYQTWLDAAPERRLVYVPRDYDAEADYWTRVREQLPANASERLRERVDEALDRAERWPSRMPPPAPEQAGPGDWFAVQSAGKAAMSSARKATICDRLDGPWSSGVDVRGAALVRDDTLRANDETVLLSGDDRPLAMSWNTPNGSRVLVVASGTFLLNGALAGRPARWPLAWRTVDWAGQAWGDETEEAGPVTPRRVAFVEGRYVTGEAAGPPSIFDVLRNLRPFLIVTLQALALGVAATLSMALSLRKRRGEEGSDADRPVAHPEALGALLARASQASEARAVLETYRRWRTSPTGRAGPGRAQHAP